jgi:predicted heme/steroid binding protein
LPVYLLATPAGSTKENVFGDYPALVFFWGLNNVFMPETLPEYTASQLALRNGQDRDDIWVAYRGQIYDVAKSRLWRNGQHYEHWAGQDLTTVLADAPHNANVFDKFQVVGKLVKR